ncbi:MAG: class I SAM-dependent methyltransferase [DPANN group archaeon]|nr:class I SAM-dependent methyltransferase [DPANN group archaeon]
MNRLTRGYGFLEVFLAKKRASIANDLIPDNIRSGSILDIGCGSYPFFLNTIKFNKKYGIDNSLKKDALNTKKMFLKKYNILNNKSLPFEDNYFDCITLLAVIEHLDNSTFLNILKECKRVLKKDGLLIMTTPTSYGHILLNIMAKCYLVSKEEINEHKYVFTKNKLESFLIKSGFDKNNININYFEFMLNFSILVKK